MKFSEITIYPKDDGTFEVFVDGDVNFMTIDEVIEMLQEIKKGDSEDN